MLDNSGYTLVLASASPRRRELLGQIGFNPVVKVAAVDETAQDQELPAKLVKRLSELKCVSVEQAANEAIVAADTIVSLDGQLLGKPADRHHAIDMLLALSGRRHEVVTGVCLSLRGRVLSTTVTTIVNMGTISHADAVRYWESGEPADKAGAYAIQGLGAVFVTRIEGSYSNVVGLPLHETVQLIQQLGCNLYDFNNYGSTTIND